MERFTLTCNENTAEVYDKNIANSLKKYDETKNTADLRRAVSSVLYKLLFVNEGTYRVGATYSIGDIVKDININDKIKFRSFIDCLTKFGVGQLAENDMKEMLATPEVFSYCRLLNVPAVGFYKALLSEYEKIAEPCCAMFAIPLHDMLLTTYPENYEYFDRLQGQFIHEYVERFD